MSDKNLPKKISFWDRFRYAFSGKGEYAERLRKLEEDEAKLAEDQKEFETRKVEQDQREEILTGQAEEVETQIAVEKEAVSKLKAQKGELEKQIRELLSKKASLEEEIEVMGNDISVIKLVGQNNLRESPMANVKMAVQNKKYTDIILRRGEDLIQTIQDLKNAEVQTGNDAQETINNKILEFKLEMLGMLVAYMQYDGNTKTREALNMYIGKILQEYTEIADEYRKKEVEEYEKLENAEFESEEAKQKELEEAEKTIQAKETDAYIAYLTGMFQVYSKEFKALGKKDKETIINSVKQNSWRNTYMTDIIKNAFGEDKLREILNMKETRNIRSNIKSESLVAIHDENVGKIIKEVSDIKPNIGNGEGPEL